MSGIQSSRTRGYGILRRHKYQHLVKKTPCLMFITLTSSPDSDGEINDAWEALHKRILRVYPDFQYAKIRTWEGYRGVLHVICRAKEFIPKEWLSKQWGDTFKAPIVWSTQAYGNKRTLLKYLVGYFGHHTKFIFSASRNWIFYGFSKKMHSLFVKYSFSEALYAWESLLLDKEALETNVRHSNALRQHCLLG